MAISYGVILGVCAVMCAALPAEKLPILKEAPKEVLFKLTDGRQPFVLECQIADGDSNGVQFSWRKNGKPFTLGGSEITQRKGEGSLVFINPKDEDAGQYQCLATSNAGTASTRIISVKKAYINAPKLNTQVVNPTEGKPYKLDCPIPDAYPKPTITWLYQLREDPQISNEVMDARITIAPEGTMYVSSAEKKDANQQFKYVCMAHTPASEHGVPLAEYVIAKVTENSSPDNEVYEQYTSKDMTVKAGERLNLFCIYGGTPLAHPDWFKDGKDVNGTPNLRVTRYNRSKGKRLLIREVWTSDEGNYRCVADNEKSKPKEHTMKLTVVSAPTAVIVPSGINGTSPGKDVIIPCQVAGIPAPRITWTYNAQPLLPSQKITIAESVKGNLTIADLTIHGAQTTDKGYYGCRAENENGDLYSETLLNVA